MKQNRLLLFDIDATLITTGGVGKGAMLAAARSLHGDEFVIDGISFAGRLDPLLLGEMLRLNGLEGDVGQVEALYHAYRRMLEERLRVPMGGGALPGVLDLLDHLERDGGAVLGLLTGNYAETGSMKLRACGIDPERFAVRVWGGDSPHAVPSRDHLPVVALERFSRVVGGPVEAGRVTIIGDTPLDVGCASCNGCRSLGVATGQYGVSALLEAGADHAVTDLSDTVAVAGWLLAE